MAQAWYHLGVALWLTQQSDPAVRALQKSVALAPDHGDYRYQLGAAYAQTAHYREAIPELARASKQLSTNAVVWATLGDAYQQLSRYKEARDAYRQSLRFDPKNDCGA